MKNLIFRKFGPALLAVAVSVFPGDLGASVPLVKDGKAVAKIYLSNDQKAAEPGAKTNRGAAVVSIDTAVEELNYHLEKMSGTRLPVERVQSAGDIQGPAILLGQLAEEAGARLTATPDKDALRVISRDSQVLIAGESDAATLNGVYGLLNRLGCEWVMPGTVGEVIPRQATVSVPEMDVVEKPSFAIRDLWYRGGKKLNTPEQVAEFILWKQRQRMTDWPRNTFGEGHRWGSFIKQHREEFEKDPTMLALVRGPDGALVRKGPQLESTHPRVVELFVEDIRKAFAKNNWPKDKAVAFPIGPNDGLGYSISTESANAGTGRIDPLLGVPDSTDLIVLLGNQILEKIEKEFPNVSLGFYIYSNHADFPAKYKPHPRINVFLAPISYSRFHSVADKNSKTWPHYQRVVEEWSKLSKEQGNKVVYRGYNWNLAENMLPFSKLRIVGEEIPWYFDSGVVAVKIEATKAWAVNGPHDFLLAKLLWDAKRDWKEVVHEYCQAAFGKGAGAMEEYFLKLTDRQHAAGQEAGSYHAFPLIYDLEFVKAGRELIERAVREAELPEEKTRAGFFRYPLDQLEAYLRFQQACGEFKFSEAARFFQKLKDDWQAAYDENGNLVAKEVPNYLKRFLEKFVQEAVKYSSEPYRIVSRIPDELPTMLDPLNVGEQLNFQGVGINDTNHLRTRTWSSTWDAQGLGAYRSGSVWYRLRFDLPADLDGKPLGLFIGGADDEVQIWLNGTFVGSGKKFSVPFVFDLTEAFKAGGENLLAIKVVRNSSINELGTGGLLRQSFLFTGPRVELAPEPGGAAERVLPGGEVEPEPEE